MSVQGLANTANNRWLNKSGHGISKYYIESSTDTTNWLSWIIAPAGIATDNVGPKLGTLNAKNSDVMILDNILVYSRE